MSGRAAWRRRLRRLAATITRRPAERRPTLSLYSSGSWRMGPLVSDMLDEAQRQGQLPSGPYPLPLPPPTPLEAGALLVYSCPRCGEAPTSGEYQFRRDAQGEVAVVRQFGCQAGHAWTDPTGEQR